MSEPASRPPIATAPISVLLFAHALSTETSDAVRAWQQYLDTLSRPCEILLVQETRPEVAAGPTDDAPPLSPAVRVFAYDRAFGFRDAVNEAIRAAQHPLLAFCTADKQYQPNELERMLKAIDQVDLVAGYRAWGQTPPWRVALDMVIGVLSRVLIGVTLEPRKCWLGSPGRGRRWVARWIFGVRVTDPECSFRLVRREVFTRLPIQSGGPFVNVEILAKANHLSCYLAEEPVTWTPPGSPHSDAITFGEDAKLVFRAPDFGSHTIVTPTPIPPTEVPAVPPT
jgi:glycosyltransferase involved in cell wall biosynthesis